MPGRKDRVHLGCDEQLFTRDGVRQFQTFGAEELVGDLEAPGICDAALASVLGIAQDGKAHIRAVDSQLVGSSGYRPKCEFT